MHLPSTATELIARARESERLGRYDAARTCYERALHAARGASGATAPAALLRWIGNTYRASGDAAAAEDCFLASLASAEAHGSSEDIAHATNWLGVVAQEHGDFAHAQRLYTAARAHAERAGDARTVALVVQNLAVLATMQGEPARALRHNLKCLELYEQIGDNAAAAPLYNNLGLLLTELRQWDRATAAFDACAAACARAGDLHTRAVVEISRAELSYARGDLRAAIRCCMRARQLAQQIGHRVVVGETYRWAGAIWRDLGDVHAAEPALAVATEIARELDNPLLAAAVQRELGLLFRRAQRHHEALQALNRAHAFYSGAHAKPLVADVARLIREIEEMFLEIVQQWSESIEQKDLYTSGHCRRVAEYACTLAHAAALDAKVMSWFHMGALLHDVGKIAIPAGILNKPGPLSESERAVMERHPVIGEQLLGSMQFPWDIRPMIRSHHERWDGRGYPDGLSGAAIPLAARILCIADVFDALTSERSYRPAYTAPHALQIMQSDAGMFDPDLLRLFARLARKLRAA